MKNKLSLIALLAIVFGSCQKEDNGVMPSSSPGQSSQRTTSSFYSNIGPVPASFTQKVLLENFTGASYGKCPDNDYMISSAQSQYPNRIIAASFHKDDRLQGTPTFDLINFMNNGNTPQIPAVMQNRIVYNSKVLNDNGTWNTNLSSTLSGMPSCGLAISSSIQGNQLSMNIHAGFSNTLSGNYKMCVYLIENNVHYNGIGYDQANASNNVSSSPFYNMGNPIVGYIHNNVARKIVTSISGVTVPSSFLVPGGHMIQNMSMDLPASLNNVNMYLIAFVYNTSTMQVMNVQQAKIGTTVSWD